MSLPNREGGLIMKRYILITLFALCVSSSLSHAACIVEVQIVRTGDNAQVDTIFVGVPHHFLILIENSWLPVTGMSLGFKVYGDGELTWSWDAQPSGYPDYGYAAVTVVPGCRMDPNGDSDASDAFDMTGLVVSEINMDGISDDTLHVGGVGLMKSLGVGPLEPMLAFHFTPQDLPDESVEMICIDSAFVPPSGAFMLDGGGKSSSKSTPYCIPIFDGPFCWPVAEMSFILGDFDGDGQITVGDVVEMIMHIFQGRANIVPLAAGDVNCDGNVNVGDAIYLINYIFRYGPAPGCP
jgi:hypothetical protein